MPRLVVEIVKHDHRAKGFVVELKRWSVRRPSAWLNRCRRLAKDWENRNHNALAILHLASARNRGMRHTLAYCILFVLLFTVSSWPQTPLELVQQSVPKESDQWVKQLRHDSQDDLLDILEANAMPGTTFDVDKCLLVHFDPQYGKETLDTRYYYRDGPELLEGRLLLHGVTRDKHVTTVNATGGTVIVDFSSIQIRENDPDRYWRAAVALDTLARRLGASCNK
jgi:hypothetical protein